MGSFIQSAALGYILGIITARSIDIQFIFIWPLASIGTGLLIWSLALKIMQKLSWPITLLALFLLGTANTLHFLDTNQPGHLDRVIRECDQSAGVTIEGFIKSVPDQRERYTIVPLYPYRIIDSQGTTHHVTQGKLYVKVYPSIGDDYFKLIYGAVIAVRDATIRDSFPAMNPGAFDMKNFLRNQSFYGTTTIRQPEQLTIMGEGFGNPLVYAADSIKYHLLQSIKQTLPFPESSFLGGVLLGLRSGLSPEILDTFRASGVSHVLAVSGLHVTIITVFFMGIFALVKLPKSSAFILIIAALILFTLITGARPSTIRAAIMNGVTLLFYYFRGLKLDRSFLLGISVAALVILSINPLVLLEASFLFSFAAILSLSILSRPLWELGCRHLRGFFRIILFLEICYGVSIWLVDPRLFLTQWHWTVTALVFLAIGLLLDQKLPVIVEFRRFPKWFTMFAAAQLAIQIGMLPITCYFFKKISITSPLANFIAIPLIGVIVQLGLFAGILGQIPVIGPWLALCLNASNWLAIKVFLGTAYFFGTGFPYPDITPPTLPFMIVYYSIVALLPAQAWFHYRVFPRFKLVRPHWQKPAVKVRLVLSGILLAALILNTAAIYVIHPHDLTVTFLSPTMFQMGGGSSVLIQTPHDTNFLIDGGTYSEMMDDREIILDIGAKVITPALLTLRVQDLHGVILSSARADYAGGLGRILGNPAFQIRAFHHGLPFENLTGTEPVADILAKLEDPALLDPKREERSELVGWALKNIFTSTTQRQIPVIPLREDMILYEETVHQKTGAVKLSLEVIGPPVDRFTGKYNTSSNSVVLLLTYGKTSFLLTSNIDRKAQTYLSTRYGLEADILQIPANGSTYSFDGDFAKAVNPQIAVVSPQSTRWQRKRGGIHQEYENLGIRTFDTTRDGAVTVSTDGTHLNVRTQINQKTLEINR